MRWIIWIFCLSLLSVAVKNSEEGLGGDAPLYASISEHIANTGDYFALEAKVPDFRPSYTEHPHLSFWLQALIFKIFGAHDWSARLLGHLYYLAFLLLFFLSMRALVSENAAVLGTLFLWIQPHFNATFSSFLLDPGALFWGTVFLVTFSQSLTYNRGFISFFSGIALGLCFLTKGLTVLGFGPPALVILALHLYIPNTPFDRRALGERLWQSTRHSLHALGAFYLVIFLYMKFMHQSSAPHFLEFYWKHQVGNRFSNLWTWKHLFLKEFWWPLLKDSLGFLLLCPFALTKMRNNLKGVALPLSVFFSFVFAYAPAHRFGGHYLIMFLPSIAWLSAMALERFLKQNDLLVFFSQGISIFAFAVLQYIGTPIHGSRPHLTLKVLRESIAENTPDARVTYLDNYPGHEHFITASRLVWYSKTAVVYSGQDPWPPSRHRKHYLYSPDTGELDPDRLRNIESLGWCRHYSNKSSVLFKACSV